MAENTMSGCTGSCHSCGSSCDTQTGERKTSFFDKLESISEHFDNVGEENVLQMLNDIVAELENEDYFILFMFYWDPFSISIRCHSPMFTKYSSEIAGTFETTFF